MFNLIDFVPIVVKKSDRRQRIAVNLALAAMLLLDLVRIVLKKSDRRRRIAVNLAPCGYACFGRVQK